MRPVEIVRNTYHAYTAAERETTEGFCYHSWKRLRVPSETTILDMRDLLLGAVANGHVR